MSSKWDMPELNPQYYTYKITFEDLPGYFYYGKHKDKGDLESYLGTPRTWRRIWDLFKPRKQVLQWYKTWEEVSKAEDSIIKETWKSRYSLNENYGGCFSEEACREGGRKTGKRNVLSMNSHLKTVQQRKKNGELTGRENILKIPKEKRRELGRRSGKKTGSKNAKVMNSHPNTSLSRRDSSNKFRRPVVNITTKVRYESAKEAEERTGVKRQSITACCRGRRKKAGGFEWGYKDA